ncbi:little elongation complex subunit 1, partial [Silurus asotus]
IQSILYLFDGQKRKNTYCRKGQKKHISDSTNSLEENIKRPTEMEKGSISQQELQAIKSLMLLNNTHKNVSVENQLLALKEVNTRQNLEIRGLKCKISSMEKSFRLMEEKLYKVENELNKDRIHALLTETSELPVLRDEEKHVISEFCVNESLAETFLSVILEKIKVERGLMGHDLLQSLCRVYVGVCQQRGDSHKAHALAYRLLKEGEIILIFHYLSTKNDLDTDAEK